jgi:hypothetical protein
MVDEYPLLTAEPDANAAHLLTGKPACISLLAPRYRKAELLGSDFSTLNLWRLDDEPSTTITEKQAGQLASRMARAMVKAVQWDYPFNSNVYTDDKKFYFGTYAKPVVYRRWLSLDRISAYSIDGAIVRGAGLFRRTMEEFKQLAVEHGLPVTIVTVENIHSAAMLHAARNAGFRLLHNEYHSTWADLAL